MIVIILPSVMIRLPAILNWRLRGCYVVHDEALWNSGQSATARIFLQLQSKLENNTYWSSSPMDYSYQNFVGTWTRKSGICSIWDCLEGWDIWLYRARIISWRFCINVFLDRYASNSKGRSLILDSGSPASTSWTKKYIIATTGEISWDCNTIWRRNWDTKLLTYNVRPVHQCLCVLLLGWVELCSSWLDWTLFFLVVLNFFLLGWVYFVLLGWVYFADVLLHDWGVLQ